MYAAFFELKRQTIYKFNVFMRILGAFLAATVQFYLWKTIGANTMSDTSSISSYSIISTIYISLLPASNVANQIATLSMKGRLPYELIRPMNFFLNRISSQLGRLIYLLLVFFIPLVLIYRIIFNIHIFEVSYPVLIFFVFSSAIGLLISFEFGFILGSLSLLTTRIGGFISLLNGLMIIFGGSVLPISIYPFFLKQISYFTPFYSVQYLPLEGLVQNRIVTPYAMCIQLFWAISLFALANYLFKISLNRANQAGG